MRQLDDTCIVLAEVAWSFLWLSKIHQDPYLIIFCIYLLSLHLFALSFASPEICEFLQVLWSFELRLSMTFRHLGLVPCLMSDVVLGLQGGPDAWCFRLRRLSRPSRCTGSPFAPDDPVITPTRPVLHCPSLPFIALQYLESIRIDYRCESFALYFLNMTAMKAFLDLFSFQFRPRSCSDASTGYFILFHSDPYPAMPLQRD